jgi:predicted HD superfamily hydrolase involved in NAD metabolism
MNYLSLLKELESHFINHQARFKHSIGVSEFAVELNHKFQFGLDDELLRVTGLLHDYAKIYSFDESIKMLKKYENEDTVNYYKNYPTVIHAILGAHLVKELFNINDECFQAIYYHTTGTSNMTRFMEVIYVSDVVERGRTYEDAEFFRNLVLENFDNGLFKILESIIEMLNKKNQPIEINTYKAYEYYRK